MYITCIQGVLYVLFFIHSFIYMYIICILHVYRVFFTLETKDSDIWISGLRCGGHSFASVDDYTRIKLECWTKEGDSSGAESDKSAWTEAANIQELTMPRVEVSPSPSPPPRAPHPSHHATRTQRARACTHTRTHTHTYAHIRTHTHERRGIFALAARIGGKSGVMVDALCGNCHAMAHCDANTRCHAYDAL